MRVELAPHLTLSRPVIAAAGCFGFGETVSDLADASALGALVTPTITKSARPGNPMPRTAETAAGLLHSLGMPNPGLDAFLSEALPALRRLPCPAIVSLRGESEAEWSELARALYGGGVKALELNLSVLSLDGEPAILKAIGAAVRSARRAGAGPLIAKLPAANVEIGAAARAAVDAGADAVAVSQAFPGVAVRLSSRRFRLPGISGELSGPCIKPLALYQVWRVAQTVKCPIIGSGGIMTAEDAVEFLIAGALAVGVGIASSIHPTAISNIAAGIHQYLRDEQIAAVSALTRAGHAALAGSS
ncbi:MAG TPA: hypothetical protein VKT77_07850 [Chthonomonadaceae bacterium]|nr:hypothetical protein [Chthonomonadaceae bacterium]